MSKKTEKILLIYVEGDTEEVFYKMLLQAIKTKYGITRFSYSEIRTINIKGIGNMKTKLVSKVKREYIDLKEYRNKEIHVLLAYDTDVFQYSPKPPFKISDVKKELNGCGVAKVFELKAEKSIEDWFLKDLTGLCNYLKIAKPSALAGSNGIEKIKNLFKKGSKIYIKGNYTNKFLDSVNFDILLTILDKELKPLLDLLT